MGNTVNTKNFDKDFGAGLKNMVGGEVDFYTKMFSEARETAIKKMIKQVESMGSDAIVNVGFASGDIIQGAAKILASGTAVKFV